MPEPLTLEQIIYQARSLHRMGLPLEPFFDGYGVTEEVRERVVEAITPRTASRDEPIGVGPGVDVFWADRMSVEQWRHWSAQEHYLRFVKEWPGDTVDSIAVESEFILRRIPDPLRAEPSSGKGLVIGYVQSGKTANYTALIARAVDAGYRLIIVLAGIHNALRAQTQKRLDRELGAYVGEDEIGVERPDAGHQWIRLTERGDGGDFRSHGSSATMLQGTAPVLLVIKKSCQVLRRLDEWIEGANTEILLNCPTLIIDDEADQASINTGQDRAVLTSGADEEEEVEDDDVSPSTTNRLIRLIVQKLPKTAYVAYTATPFANVLIDSTSHDREVGDDLYPTDFIHSLPRPDGYTGTTELFGDVSNDGRDVLRYLEDDEIARLRPAGSRRRGISWDPEITPSIESAIDEFILGGAVRIQRGDGGEPHTMLVHTTHLTFAHQRLTDVVRIHVEAIQGEIAYGTGATIRRLREKWEAEYSRALDDQHEFFDIEPCINEVISSLLVLELNSASEDALDYEAPGPIRVIAVGGNRLSRGLTLEGLTVSVFLRTTNMCDTLLQMARWYGYHPGYEDLIRIYTTRDIAEWFSELVLVEGDMRDEVERLALSGLTPREQGLCLREHPSLLLTSRAKSRNAVTVRAGYSGSHPQTIVLPIHDRTAMDLNVSLVRELASRLPFDLSEEGLVAREVSPDIVVDFIRSLALSSENRVFNQDSISQWIEAQVSRGRLDEWTIFIPGTEDPSANRFEIFGNYLGMPRRSRLRLQDSIGVLVDPRHEAIDLPGGASAYRNVEGNYETVRMRSARPDTNGLLLIYLIDPASDSNSLSRDRLIAESVLAPDAVIGVALSLPFVSDNTATNVVVGGEWKDD